MLKSLRHAPESMAPKAVQKVVSQQGRSRPEATEMPSEVHPLVQAKFNMAPPVVDPEPAEYRPNPVTSDEWDARMDTGPEDFGPSNPFREDDLTRGTLTPEQYRFKKEVYRKHVRRASAGRTFALQTNVADRVEFPSAPGVFAHAEVVDAFEAMLAAANLDAAEEGESDIFPGLGNAFRSADWQFNNWNSSFETRDIVKGILARNPFKYTSSDVSDVAKAIGAVFGAPGYSKHQHSLAVDFSGGKRFGSKWLFEWMHREREAGVSNAQAFGFKQLKGEAWHWNYTMVPTQAGGMAQSATLEQMTPLERARLAQRVETWMREVAAQPKDTFNEVTQAIHEAAWEKLEAPVQSFIRARLQRPL